MSALTFTVLKEAAADLSTRDDEDEGNRNFVSLVTTAGVSTSKLKAGFCGGSTVDLFAGLFADVYKSGCMASAFYSARVKDSDWRAGLKGDIRSDRFRLNNKERLRGSGRHPWRLRTARVQSKADYE